MIPIETAELAVAIARGLIKLGGRLDRLLAEKVATLGGLTLKPPPVEFSIGPNRMVDELQKLINAAAGINRDPLGQRRKVLVELLKSAQPDPDELREFYALLFPGGALALKIDPDEEYLKFLRSALPSSSLDDADARTAAFYVAAFSIDPGSDNRQLGYPMRTGLLVADVLAEFGAEQTQLFVRDEGLRTVVQAVLSRFAQPELESFNQWSPLLRHTLSATLNGALEAKAAWNESNPWLGAVLDALIEARDAAGQDGDNYLLGLLQGKGYQVLISQGMAKAAQVLAATDADIFQQIAADVLKQALPLVAADSKDFGGFFTEHWADLLHAALQSLEPSPLILTGAKQALTKTGSQRSSIRWSKPRATRAFARHSPRKVSPIFSAQRPRHWRNTPNSSSPSPAFFRMSSAPSSAASAPWMRSTRKPSRAPRCRRPSVPWPPTPTCSKPPTPTPSPTSPACWPRKYRRNRSRRSRLPR